MLTSFFGKSKPVNTIVVLVYMTIGFIVATLSLQEGAFDTVGILKKAGVWALYVFTMFVLTFISQKNELTRRTSYRILLFASFTLAFPQAINSPEILISGVFIMLALRRILSLRSGRHMERKLFDAGFWIGLSILTFFWSGLFALVLIGALFYYGKSSWRYWFIPLLALVAIAILVVCYGLYTDQAMSIWSRIYDPISFDFSAYSNLKLLLPIAFCIAFMLWTVWDFIKELGTSSVALRPTFVLILFFAIIALGMVLVYQEKNGAAWYYFAIPLAIIGTSFFENASSKWISEALLWMIVLLPFAHYVL